MIRLLEQRPDGISVYEMENDDLKVVVSSYGVTLMEIDMKDQDGSMENVVLGYPSVEDYMAKSGTYFGAVVGRTSNRLAKGEFTLNGKEYHSAITNGPNSLHGGEDGFSYRNFESRVDGDRLIFTYVSKDMEEGYPGTLKLTVTLELKGNELHIAYDAIADQDTLCSLTHHTYFNLNPDEPVSDQLLKIGAVRHGLIDENVLFTGQYREMANTPLDFREFAPVRQGYDESDRQVQNAKGIDHHFVIEEGMTPLVLKDPKSKRVLEVETSMPGLQVYSGNYLEECSGRNDRSYGLHWGLAVEPQYVPDSIHTQEHPDALLKANTPLHEEIVYRFFKED